MKVDDQLPLSALKSPLRHLFEVSGAKIKSLIASWDPKNGTPVFTYGGKYTTRGWTEWTQGFMYGWSILQYEAVGEEEYLKLGKEGALRYMAPHLTHTGVHDHGFNNISTYGNLRRLMLEGKIPHNDWELNYYELALKVSGAVQASRWTPLPDGKGYIYSFNGPHSLFIDTIRTLRILAVAHQLGHVLMGEGDKKISLLERLIQHAKTTAEYIIYYGEGKDAYDIRGRVAHEAIFNINSGAFRCPSTQQGYSPFSTWTRGLSWAVLGYAELLEFIDTVPEEELEPFGGKGKVEEFMLKAALATSDFYIEHSAADGVPYWDTGAPGLVHLGDWRNRPADPYNDYEPVDSSAAAIAAQGLARLGRFLERRGNAQGSRYFQAALTVAKTLLAEPYLSEDPNHQGLLLHTVYHRPNGWDYIPPGRKVPCGESALWGDYHLMELAVYLQRLLQSEGS